MKFALKKIHHLIRYTVIAGAVAYILYLTHWFDFIVFFLIGPAVYIAYHVKELVIGLLPLPAASSFLDNTLFLFPVTMVYYGFGGFLIKTLWNERGWIRTVSLLVLFVFLAFIHIQSGFNLLTYLTVESY